MPFPKTFEHSQALFDAAMAEFIDQGYDKASINTILKNAGMSKGQFYYHFNNKEGLYMALIDILIARKLEFLSGAMRPEQFEQDIFTILKIQLQHGFAFARQHPIIFQFGESFVREKGNPIYEAVQTRYSFADNAMFDQLITRAYERGEFREDLPLSFVRKMIAYHFDNAADILAYGADEAFEANMNHLVDFLRTGLARQK